MVARGIVWAVLFAGCVSLAWADEMGAVKQQVVAKPEELTGAVAIVDGRRTADVVWLRLSQQQIPEASALALRGWVANGGTLWTETDAIGLFGQPFIRPTARELFGHARRACAPLATPLIEGVDDLWYRLDPTAVFVGAKTSAVPLLRVADATEMPTQAKLVAVELLYGEGRVIHRPTEIHQGRAQGKTFEANLKLCATTTNDEVIIGHDLLAAAQTRAIDAYRKAGKAENEAEVKSKLLSILLAYRLTWAEHLTRTGKYDDALTVLKAVAADLPQDPDVYLAVARWNEHQNRTEEGQRARQLATQAFAAANRPVPGPDAKQLRVPLETFSGAIAATGAAWEKPTTESVGVAAARTDHLLALDEYRAGDLTGADRHWQEAFRIKADLPLTPFYLGLVHRTWADDFRLAGRERLRFYTTSAQWFDAAAKLPPSKEFDAAAILRSLTWAETSRNGAAQVTKEPPDVLARGGFIYRYDATDPRYRNSPLLGNLQQAFDGAYQGVAGYGVWLDPTEVLLSPDGLTMRAMMPSASGTRGAFPTSAVVGRRIFMAGSPPALTRQCRHEFVRVVCNALTEGGFPPPAWYEAGLASGAENDPLRAQAAGLALRAGRVLTIDQLNSPALLFGRELGEQALGQAELMVKALLVRHGERSVVPFLMDLGWGASADVAFEKMTGMTQATFLEAWLAGRLPPVRTR